MTGRLAGKVALITGGASGLGLGMARGCLEEGARVALLDLADPPRDLSQRADVLSLRCDVTQPDDIDTAFDEAERRIGALDAVIVNAGVSQNSPTLALPFAQWRNAMSVNLDAAFLTAQAAGRRMVPRGRGAILFTASIYGLVAGPERIAYVASKHAVAAMAKALALEWSPKGLRVNAIAPGYVRTALLEDLIERGRVDAEALVAHTPQRRFVEIEEVARLATFLISDEASATTGLVATADGGWTANGYL